MDRRLLNLVVANLKKEFDLQIKITYFNFNKYCETNYKPKNNISKIVIIYVNKVEIKIKISKKVNKKFESTKCAI